MSNQPLTTEQLKNWRLVVGDLPDVMIEAIRANMQRSIDVADPVFAAVRILRDEFGTLCYNRTARQWFVQRDAGWQAIRLTAQQATQLLQEHAELKSTFKGEIINQYKWVDAKRDAEYAQYVEDKIVGGLE